jgi:hypothetical protein
LILGCMTSGPGFDPQSSHLFDSFSNPDSGVPPVSLCPVSIQ